jgi:hypothetical protein
VEEAVDDGSVRFGEGETLGVVDDPIVAHTVSLLAC